MKNDKSVKQIDPNRIVKRKIKVSCLGQSNPVQTIRNRISELPGILDLILNEKPSLIEIQYDITLQSYERIIESLSKVDCPVKSGWIEKLKLNWFSYIENNMRENLKSPPPACCNKPPK